MPTPTETTAPDAFSSLLAALAAPADVEDETDRGHSGDLEEDVVAFNYEDASHAQSSCGTGHQSYEFDQKDEKKSASVTVRMSQAERARLNERAAEAGLTLSAYLRSCALEAESLRAQVKEALAAIRAAGPESIPPARSAPAETSRRWWPPWASAQA